MLLFGILKFIDISETAMLRDTLSVNLNYNKKDRREKSNYYIFINTE